MSVVRSCSSPRVRQSLLRVGTVSDTLEEKELSGEFSITRETFSHGQE